MPDPNNIVIPSARSVIQLIPKCANTSIKMALARAFGYNLDVDDPLEVNNFFGNVVPKGKPRDPYPFWIADRSQCNKMHNYRVYIVVRHPEERVMSFWQDKVLTGTFGSVSRGLGVTKGMDLHDLVDLIHKTNDLNSDQHWRAQSWDAAHDARVVAFEDLQEWWATEFQPWFYHNIRLHIGELPWLNKSQPAGQEYRLVSIDQMKDRYAFDYGMHRIAKKFQNWRRTNG